MNLLFETQFKRGGDMEKGETISRKKVYSFMQFMCLLYLELKAAKEDTEKV